MKSEWKKCDLFPSTFQKDLNNSVYFFYLGIFKYMTFWNKSVNKYLNKTVEVMNSWIMQNGMLLNWLLFWSQEVSYESNTFFRASLNHVYFPSVTLCNINQGRRSFFLAHGLQNDSKTLKAVLGQAYFGVPPSKVTVFQFIFHSFPAFNTFIFKNLKILRTKLNFVLEQALKER